MLRTMPVSSDLDTTGICDDLRMLQFMLAVFTSVLATRVALAPYGSGSWCIHDAGVPTSPSTLIPKPSTLNSQ